MADNIVSQPKMLKAESCIFTQQKSQLFDFKIIIFLFSNLFLPFLPCGQYKR